MFDYIIKNGTVYDGTRSEPFTADIAVKDGKIAGIGKFDAEKAEKVIDAKGKAVTPGFIDIHTHSDYMPLLSDLHDSKLQQGVTFEITGNCGKSTVPAAPGKLDALHDYWSLPKSMPCMARESVSDYADEINKKGHVNNTGMLIGHSTLRLAVMGEENRNPTEKEMKALEDLLDRELSRGAFGMSLGLIYPPSSFSEREELLRLAKVIARHGAILAVHMRNEGARIFEAIDEMVSIAEESGAHLEISHFKILGKPQFGKADLIIEKVEAARKRGVNVNCDQYPYLATGTNIATWLPKEMHDGGRAELVKRLKVAGDDVKEALNRVLAERGGPEIVFVVDAKNNPQYNGKFLPELMKEYSLSASEMIIKLLAESDGTVACVYFMIDKADMLKIMKKDYIAVGSDGSASSYDREKYKVSVHPRNFATFPQYFRTVMDNSLMPIKDAVYKCTALPASILGVTDRGLLKEGLAADICIFDTEKIKSNSEYSDSRYKPDGIEYVFVNGKLALDHKEVTDAHAGKVLLKK